MGEKTFFQPLTREDKITVVLYRIGILLSALIISLAAFVAVKSISRAYPPIVSGIILNVFLLLLYIGVGLSVFFIHLYVGKFYRVLKKIYFLALACLGLLFLIGHGNPVVPLLRTPSYGALLLIPLSLCLGFVAAKEAFCFRLLEGYLLALFLPAFTFFYAIGVFTPEAAAFCLAFIAAMLVFFMFRKIFMPIHFDIGDKSAYQP